MADVDIIPKADKISHEETDECVCGPEVIFVEGGSIAVHQALDDRAASPWAQSLRDKAVASATRALAEREED